APTHRPRGGATGPRDAPSPAGLPVTAPAAVKPGRNRGRAPRAPPPRARPDGPARASRAPTPPACASADLPYRLDPLVETGRVTDRSDLQLRGEIGRASGRERE